MEDRIKQFVSLLVKWNKQFNLTAITDLNAIQTHHIEDSLSIKPYLHGKHILDVGTGAGFPGIPLAVAYPDKQFVLLDSNGKKTRFLTQVVYELGLRNVEVVQARVEDYHAETLFDSIVSRAFSSLETFVTSTKHLIAPDGQFLAMKGKVVDQELKQLPEDIAVTDVIALDLSEKSIDRHLFILSLVDKSR